jgi:hypothetical protein
MENFIASTAIKMTPIKPYGLFHLSFFIIGLLLSIYIAIKLKKLSIKKLNNLLFILGIILTIFELYKQLFYTFYIGKGSYQWWIFPFQLCSMPMYFCLILPFIKKPKVYNAIMSFLVSYNLLGGFVAFLEPSGLIHPYLFLTIHAFSWHMLVVFIGLLVGFNQNIKYKLKDFINNFYLFVILCLIAFGINLIIRNGINMFFVGPEISPIIVFKNISLKYGWFINDLLYIMAMSIGAFIFYYPFTKIKKEPK